MFSEEFVERVNYLSLKKAIKNLNSSGLLEKPMKSAARKKPDLLENFVRLIEDIDEEGLVNDLPESVYEFYSEIADLYEEMGEAAKDDVIEDEPEPELEDELEDEPEDEPEPEPEPEPEKDAKPAETEPEDEPEEDSAYKEAYDRLVKAGVDPKKIDTIEFVYKTVKNNKGIITVSELMKLVEKEKLLTNENVVVSAMINAS